MSIERAPSCEDESEPALLPLEEARRRIAHGIVPIGEDETVSLSRAAGRVLASDVVAPHDVPARTNSAMDGYAIDRASIPASGERALAVLGTAWAGRPFEGRVGEGEAVRIFTGAVMPDGADTVVIQERVAREGERVRIDADVEPGRNVRAAGEDVRAGRTVFVAGRRLEAADVGVLASLGIGRLRVVRRPRVAFFTTGDELRALADDTDGAPPPAGCLYDSNRHTLAALLDGLGVDAVDLGIVPDDIDATRRALETAAARSDLVVTSGGISAGDADFVARAFHEIGDVAFWKIAMRPGRPLAFGRLGRARGEGAVGDRSSASDTGGGALFFGLPGNPVAVMVTFLEFVQPALRRLAGMTDVEPLALPARCLSTLRKSPGRVEYQRGVMRVEDGELVVESTGKQGAGRLSSMSAANCLIVVAAEVDGVAPGDTVRVQPFRGLLPG